MSIASTNRIGGEWSEGGAALLSPPPPAAAYFDREIGAWVLSRYADVLEALREPSFIQAGARPGSPAARDAVEQSLARSDLMGDFGHAELSAWRHRIETLTERALDRLPEHRPIDLVRDFIQPWSRTVLHIVAGAEGARARRLAMLARFASGSPVTLAKSRLIRSCLAARQKVADAEVERFFRNEASPAAKSMFLGVLQTLPSFLANAFLALLRHPEETARLRAQPELARRAVEELLRYAGLVHTLVRQAAGNADLAGVRITEGERVILRLASANRDPEQFERPDNLDFARRSAGQLALGAGPHSCAGAPLVRMLASIATATFAAAFQSAEESGKAKWLSGPTLCFAVSLPAVLRRGLPRTSPSALPWRRFRP